MCSRPFETRSFPNSLAASLAVLPSMSLFPKAPFDLSVFPSMSRAARRLRSFVALAFRKVRSKKEEVRREKNCGFWNADCGERKEQAELRIADCGLWGKNVDPRTLTSVRCGYCECLRERRWVVFVFSEPSRFG